MSTSKEPEEEWVKLEVWEHLVAEEILVMAASNLPIGELRKRMMKHLKEAKSQGAREALEMAVSRLEDSLWQCPTHGVPELGEMGDGCLECNEAMDVNVTYYDAIKTVKLLQSNLKEKI